MSDAENDKISRRDFLRKTGKLAYIIPVVHVFMTAGKDAHAQGLGLANKQANPQQQAVLQKLKDRFVSPP